MTTPCLSTEKLIAFYGDFQALFGITMHINPGEVIALIGANGAGKSTFLRCLTGLLPTHNQKIFFNGNNISGVPSYQIARTGIALAPEGRRLFPSLNVEENLLLGGHLALSGNWNLDSVYKLFPILHEKKSIPANLLSGGQQQMVAIGRALMRNPQLLLLDEISLGLAPAVIKDIYEALPAIRSSGTAILIVEQDIAKACAVADRLYCFQEGRVSLEGVAGDLDRDAISDAYFGKEH